MSDLLADLAVFDRQSVIPPSRYFPLSAIYSGKLLKAFNKSGSLKLIHFFLLQVYPPFFKPQHLSLSLPLFSTYISYFPALGPFDTLHRPTLVVSRIVRDCHLPRLIASCPTLRLLPPSDGQILSSSTSMSRIPFIFDLTPSHRCPQTYAPCVPHHSRLPTPHFVATSSYPSPFPPFSMARVR
jgi:hypothetical protein